MVKKDICLDEFRYKQVFDLSPEGIVIFNTKGKVLEANDRLLDWLGYKPKEIIGKNLIGLPFLSKTTKIEVMKNFAQRMMGKHIPDYEVEFKDKKGDIKIGLVRARPIKDKKGKIIQDFVMVSNITEKKKIEEALKESNTRYENMFYNMKRGMAIYKAIEKGRNFILIDINDYGAKISNVKIKEVIGKKVTEVFPGIKEMGLFKVFQEVYKTGKTKDHPISQYKDGEISQWFENTVYKLSEDEIVAIYKDVTDQENASEKLATKLEELEKMNKVMIGRELKMVKLKEEINKLKAQINGE